MNKRTGSIAPLCFSLCLVIVIRMFFDPSFSNVWLVENHSSVFHMKVTFSHALLTKSLKSLILLASTSPTSSNTTKKSGMMNSDVEENIEWFRLFFVTDRVAIVERWYPARALSDLKFTSSVTKAVRRLWTTLRYSRSIIEWVLHKTELTMTKGQWSNRRGAQSSLVDVDNGCWETFPLGLDDEERELRISRIFISEMTKIKLRLLDLWEWRNCLLTMNVHLRFLRVALWSVEFVLQSNQTLSPRPVDSDRLLFSILIFLSLSLSLCHLFRICSRTALIIVSLNPQTTTAIKQKRGALLEYSEREERTLSKDGQNIFV